MARQRPVTQVGRWRQFALFGREELKRITRSRWAQIRQRLMEEERQGQGAARTRQDDREGPPGLSDGSTDGQEEQSATPG